MKRYAIKSMVTGLFLTGDYVGAPETNDPGKAKLWQKRGSLIKAIKGLTYDYHCNQAKIAGRTTSTTTATGQPFCSLVPAGPMTPVYEIVEIDFSPTVVSATIVNATVGVELHGPIGLATIS